MSSHTNVRRWRRGDLAFAAGLLLFETVTGLSIWLLPFSVSNQVIVLAHTVGGLVFIGPYAWYQVRHWQSYRSRPLTHYKLTGYFSLAATVTAAVSGGVLTYQALFTTGISYGWDRVHIIATLAVIGAVGAHVLSPIFRNVKARHHAAIRPILSAVKQFGGNTVFIAGALLAMVGLTVYAYSSVDLKNHLPSGYALPYGRDSAFALSLATTSTGGAFDVRTLARSQSCGQAGCHKEIYDEWAPSAHRYAAMDPAFRAVQKRMGEQKGSMSTRYCGGCHDPISLFSGTKNLFRDELTNPQGLDEGISCVTCHTIRSVDVKGNADYTIEQPERYIGELRDGPASRFVSNFLIRAYPEQHVESFQRTLYKTPAYCGTCHKQFIDEQLNDVGWVQLQNQYDTWRKSRWNHPGDPTRTIECRECHMPLVDSSDPASGDRLDYNRAPDDGKHRSHRFLGTNQMMPRLLGLPGAEEHVRLTKQWMKGGYEIPEIADKWTSGPAVPLTLTAPDSVAPGETVSVRLRFTNNKAGHHFPTGPLDMIQAWVELIVTDARGAVIYASGTRDAEHFVEPGAFAFKSEPVDQYGNLIDHHNLWDMVGTRYSRTLFPGFSDQTTYRFTVPERGGASAGRTATNPASSLPRAVDTVRVQARLLYRKLNQPIFNALIPDTLAMKTAPVTTLSSAEKTIVVSLTE